MKIHVIFDGGPEWSKPVEGWLKPQSAKARVKQLTREREKFLADREAERKASPEKPIYYSPREVHERLSQYSIQPIEIKDAS